MDLTIESLKNFLTTQRLNFDPDAPESMMEALYQLYIESSVADSPAMREQYELLNAYVGDLPTKTQNAIADILCVLCTEHEKAAFMQGLQLGAKLVFELSE